MLAYDARYLLILLENAHRTNSSECNDSSRSSTASKPLTIAATCWSSSEHKKIIFPHLQQGAKLPRQPNPATCAIIWGPKILTVMHINYVWRPASSGRHLHISVYVSDRVGYRIDFPKSRIDIENRRNNAFPISIR